MTRVGYRREKIGGEGGRVRWRRRRRTLCGDCIGPVWMSCLVVKMAVVQGQGQGTCTRGAPERSFIATSALLFSTAPITDRLPVGAENRQRTSTAEMQFTLESRCPSKLDATPLMSVFLKIVESIHNTISCLQIPRSMTRTFWFNARGGLEVQRNHLDRC